MEEGEKERAGRKGIREQERQKGRAERQRRTKGDKGRKGQRDRQKHVQKGKQREREIGKDGDRAPGRGMVKQGERWGVGQNDEGHRETWRSMNRDGAQRRLGKHRERWGTQIQ